MKVFHLLLIVPVMACAPMAAWAADDPYAAQLFAQRCASCHEAGGRRRRAHPRGLAAQGDDAHGDSEDVGDRRHASASRCPVDQRTSGGRQLSRNGGDHGTAAGGDGESVSGWRRGKRCLERRSGLVQLGRRSGEHALPDRQGGRTEGRGRAAAHTEMGVRLPGYGGAAFAAGGVSRQSVRGEPERRRLRAGRRHRLHSLDHDRAG